MVALVVVVGWVAAGRAVEGEVAKALTKGSAAAPLPRPTVRPLLRCHHSNKPAKAKQASNQADNHPRSREKVLVGPC